MIDAQARGYRLGESSPRRERANICVAERVAFEPDGEARDLAYHESNVSVAGHAIGQQRNAACGWRVLDFAGGPEPGAVRQRNRRGG